MAHCRVCAHPEAEQINQMLAKGRTIRDVVGRFPNLTKSGVHRHKAHVALLLMQANLAAGEDVLTSALGRLAAIEGEARRLGKLAERRGDIRGAGTLLVSEATKLLELASRLKGLLQSGTAVQVVQQIVVAADDPRAHEHFLNLVAALIREMQADAPAVGFMVEAWLQRRHDERRQVKVAEAVERVRDRFPPAQYVLPEGTVRIPQGTDRDGET